MLTKNSVREGVLVISMQRKEVTGRRSRLRPSEKTSGTLFRRFPLQNNPGF
jgi:hypothetical protein